MHEKLSNRWKNLHWSEFVANVACSTFFDSITETIHILLSSFHGIFALYVN